MNTDWSTPQKIKAREDTVLKYLPTPNQYWSMAGLCDQSGCELDHILPYINIEQFHGVEIDFSTYSRNRFAYPEANWHLGDFYDVMSEYDQRGLFNPSLVNADFTKSPKKLAEYVGRLMALLTPYNTVLIVNWSLEHRGFKIEPEEALDMLGRQQQFCWSMRQGWEFDEQVYLYPGAGHSRCTMGTFVFENQKQLQLQVA